MVTPARVLNIVGLGALLFLSAPIAHATSCQRLTSQEAYAQAHAVFQGKVLRIQNTDDATRITFDVGSVQKGTNYINKGRLVIEQPRGEDGYIGFEEDTRYLVYARDGIPQGWKRHALSAHMCAGTRPLFDRVPQS